MRIIPNAPVRMAADGSRFGDVAFALEAYEAGLDLEEEDWKERPLCCGVAAERRLASDAPSALSECGLPLIFLLEIAATGEADAVGATGEADTARGCHGSSCREGAEVGSGAMVHGIEATDDAGASRASRAAACGAIAALAAIAGVRSAAEDLALEDVPAGDGAACGAPHTFAVAVGGLTVAPRPACGTRAALDACSSSSIGGRAA